MTDVACSLWVGLCGNEASGRESVVNGRVFGTNPYELPSAASSSRVNTVISGAGEGGKNLCVDLAVTFKGGSRGIDKIKKSLNTYKSNIPASLGTEDGFYKKNKRPK